MQSQSMVSYRFLVHLVVTVSDWLVVLCFIVGCSHCQQWIGCVMLCYDWLCYALLLVVVNVRGGLVVLCFVIGCCHCQ